MTEVVNLDTWLKWTTWTLDWSGQPRHLTELDNLEVVHFRQVLRLSASVKCRGCPLQLSVENLCFSQVSRFSVSVKYWGFSFNTWLKRTTLTLDWSGHPRHVTEVDKIETWLKWTTFMVQTRLKWTTSTFDWGGQPWHSAEADNLDTWLKRTN